MAKRTQRGYSTSEQIHAALQFMALADDQTIAHELEQAVLMLIAQRITQQRPVSLDMLNLYLFNTGVQVVLK